MERVPVTYTLFVLLALVIFVTTKATLLEEAQTALIHCNGTSIFDSDEEQESIQGIKYTWTFRGKPVEDIYTFKDRATVSKFGDLVINNFTSKDYGLYKCEIDVNASGIRVVDSVDKNVDEKYVISDKCSLHSCITAGKCYHPGLPNTCPGRGEICCKRIQEKDKHHCHHFLGECLEYCGVDIEVTRADDCEEGTKCCVLLATVTKT